jgi:cyclophilin family peptidyl-prolyl cis-trans isomerase
LWNAKRARTEAEGRVRAVSTSVKTTSLWNAGLVCLLLASIACTPPPDPDGPYEGSCPILIECTVQANSLREVEYLEAYGEQGTCWQAGPNHWGPCRDSCVAALDSLNVESVALGLPTCGTCELDSDCAEFADARCDAGYCGRRQLGDVSDEDDNDTDAEPDMPTEATTGEGATDGSIDADCLVDDTPTVVIDTSLGVMVVELDSLAAPEATQIFLQHVSAHYYDGSIIHRVIPEVLIQGGTYGPGPVLLESSIDPSTPNDPIMSPTLEHQPGVIALLPTSDGSHLGSGLGSGLGPQWYMTVGPTPPSAAASGVVFGALIDGAAVRDAISNVPVTTVAWVGFELRDIPEEDVVVTKAVCVAEWP